MRKPKKHVFALVLLLSFVNNCYSQACNAAANIGHDPTTANTEQTTTSTDRGFLDVSDTFNCYGTVDSWQFFRTNGAGFCHNLEFQVWRPIDVVTRDYMLVGGNTYTCAGGAGGMKTFTPMAIEQIPVQPNDLYGWYVNTVQANRFMSYEQALSGSGLYDTFFILDAGAACTYTVAGTCSWLANVRQAAREYALQVNLDTRPDPYFTNLPATAPVYENEPIGTYVYTVEGFNSFNYNDVVDPDLTYAITGGSCNAANFNLDASTGILLTAALLNNEATGSCTLVIEVAEGPNTFTATLTIDVLNVNEGHTINNLPASVTRDAAATGNNVLMLDVDVTDIDGGTGHNFYILYSDPPSGPFTINNGNGRVETSQDLAYWNGPTVFDLGIVAEDGDFSDGPKELTIVITNLRTDPVITNLDHTVTVAENSAAAGTQLYQVVGLPQPDGAGGRGDPVVYSITNVYPLDVASPFTINAGTGWVEHIVNPGFDYFVTNPYIVEVEVVDSGTPGFTSQRKNLTVEITWVNQPPVHTTTIFATTILESEVIGTALPGIVLDATDRDIVIGDWIDYTMHNWGTQGSHLFDADNITNNVFLIGDVSLTPGQTSYTYNLNILVHDAEGEQDIANIAITVTDINDHAPVFNPTSYTGTINELAVGGTTTGVTVVATDDDGGVNAQIVFSIVEAEANLYFQVDAAGVVTNKQPIPFELYPNMTFTVLATDQGDPSLSDTATVFMTITEGNTHAPVFSPDFHSMDLRADTTVGEVVYSVTAEDEDTGTVQNITYEWMVLVDYFAIERSTGLISVDRKLVADRKHLLYVGANDNGIPTDYYSHPYAVRIDTYEPAETLVDIYLEIPLEEFVLNQEDFFAQLDVILSPWDARIESVGLKKESTVVTMYAVKSALPDLKQNQEMTKIFIDKDDLLDLLRANLRGRPTDLLTGPGFAPWEPYHVQATYPNWIIDSAGGVSLLTIISALVLAGLITMFVLLAKRYRWCCYKYRPNVSPRQVQPYTGDKNQFKLSYLNPEDAAYVLPQTKNLDLGYRSLFPPQNSKPDFKPPPSTIHPSTPEGRHSAGATRVSVHESDPEHHLAPVQNPDARPPPRSYGGQAA